MEINFSEKDLEAIAAKVAEHIKPLLKDKNKVEDTLLTVTEAASLLKTSKEQIYQWTNLSQHGLSDFPYLKAGRLLRFSRIELLGWLKNRPMVRRSSRNKNKLVAK